MAMHTDIMLRTQISFTVEERQVLDAKAARTGKSISALIRDALDVVYESWRSCSDDPDLMRQAFGSWSTVSDEGATSIEKLRTGSPLRPHN